MKTNNSTVLPALFLAGLALSGCSDQEDPDPTLIIEGARYWFEGDLLVVNVTYRNIDNFTPAPPLTANPTLHVTLNGYVAKEELDQEPGNDVNLKWFESINLAFHESNHGEPLRDRYYEDHAAEKYGAPREPGFLGPHVFVPDESYSFEFAFLPTVWYNDLDGYYTLTLRTKVTHPDTNQQMGEVIETGCFSHEYTEFYGVRGDGPDCINYDVAGVSTEIGPTLRGPDAFSKPFMLHSPPAGVEGAH